MAANSMDDRVKAGPLGPKWQKLKSRHKALSGKLFAKPDIADMLKHADESSKQIADLTKQLGQITDKCRARSRCGNDCR